MTAYDDWKTTKQEIDDEAWEDAVDTLACSKGASDFAEIMNTLAVADDVLTWLSHAVEVPQHHVHAFRDLTKLSARLRNDVEKEMKNYRDSRD